MKTEKSKLLQELEAKVKELVYGGVCIAFSGNDGSVLLLRLAMETKARVLAVTFQTPLSLEDESLAAQERAKALGAQCALLPVDVLRDARVAANTPGRFYYCERMQFEALASFAASRGIFNICDGSCADTTDEERQDRDRALRELGVRSPLLECSVTHAQARQLLRELGEAPGAMLSPSLAKRFPFDTPIERSELKLIEDGERLLRGLRLDGCYLYLHGGLARIVARRDQAAGILASSQDCVNGLKALGFAHVTLDLDLQPCEEADAGEPEQQSNAQV